MCLEECVATCSPDSASCLVCSYIWFAGIFSFDIDVLFLSLDVAVPSLVQEYLSFLTMMIAMALLLCIYL